MNIALIKQLASGLSCQVGSCSLHPDVEAGMIWGVDPYGLDFVASNRFTVGDEESAAKAIGGAERSNQGDNLHDQMQSFAS